VNAYAYCLGDPINWIDPNGEFAMLARVISQLISTPVSTHRQAWRGGRAFKSGVVNSFKKTPDPYAKTKSGMKALAKSNPEKHQAIVNEANALADEQKVYAVGAKYRLAESKVLPDELRRSKLQKLATGEALPQEMRYKFPADYSDTRSEFRQANWDLADVARERIENFPSAFKDTERLVQLIRNVAPAKY
jgi:hypothetical protein